jgi:ubiquinone/menaquinone biosynthesis C-methylase UbiE
MYRGFARLYTDGDFPQFSTRIAEFLPAIFEEYHIRPKTILDLACGEGSFAVAMAKQGFQVTGVDQSPDMLNFARKKAQSKRLTIPLFEMDIRKLALDTSFDVVTCWFDSLNYLLNLDDLETTFIKTAQHLNPNGFFFFDMNTVHWLTTLAERYAVTLERETEDIFQVHRHSFDEDTRIATFEITGFIKDNDCWKRHVDETHHERGYTLDEIRACLNKAGLTELACYETLEERLPYTSNSKRVWFITKK